MKDTDGDGWDDFEEIVNKGFDPAVDAYQFNPRVADVPKLRVQLTSLPEAYITYEESTGTTHTVEVTYGDSSTTGHVKSWGGSQSQAIEMTHTAGVSMSVEHEFGLFGGTSVGLELSYEFSHSTTNESTVEWGEEHSTEHTTSLDEMRGYEETVGTTYQGGVIRTTVRLENTGDIAYELQNLTLNAFLYNPTDPLNLGALGTLTYAGGTYQDSLDPGEVVTGLVFEANVDLPTIRKLLENSPNLVIQPAGVQMRGLGDIDFTHATTDIATRTAQVVFDYGLDREPESYRVATIRDPNNPGVTVREVLEDILRIPYTFGTGEWLDFEATEPRTTGTGFTSIRNAAMNAATSSYWIVAHTEQTEAGASTKTTYYNLVIEGYDILDLVLQKGSTLHFVYVQDTDRDGLGDRAELVYGTDPNNPDTDGDGASDYLEVNGWLVPAEGGRRVFPNPLLPDTDGDGMTDYEEYLADPRTDPTEDINQPPVIESIAATTEGITATLSLTFSDPDPGDRVHTIEVDWGDGEVEMIPIPAGETSWLGDHEYAALGDYTITARAFDGRPVASPARTVPITLTVPTAGLISWWPLNGVLGDAVGPNDGQFNFPAWGPDRWGNANRAADLGAFTGSTYPFYSVPAFSFGGLGQSFTYSVWTKAHPNSGTRIVGRGDGFNLYFHDGSRVAFGLIIGTQPHEDGVEVVAADTPAGRHVESEWNHYVGVVDAGVGTTTLRLYRNGVEVASQTFAGSYQNWPTCSFYIGNWPTGNTCNGTQLNEGGQGYLGLIDDVRVYGRALTPGEVALLFVEPDNSSVMP